MSTRLEKFKNVLEGPKLRVAGRIVENGKDTVSVKMAGYLLEIPRNSIISEEKTGEGLVILNLKSDAEILMTNVTSVDQLIGALSSRIMKGDINDDTECCDCTECCYCTERTEYSYCTDRGWPMKTRILIALRSAKFRGI